MATATLIGGAAALPTFLPRPTVDANGDFSNPASIAFVATNTGYVPLRYPVIHLWICELVYYSGKGEGKPDRPPASCNMSLRPDSITKTNQEWLNIDEKFPLRLEDGIVLKNNSIVRANVILTMRYYLWYLPFRYQKSFGFKSAKGSDGQLTGALMDHNLAIT